MLGYEQTEAMEYISFQRFKKLRGLKTQSPVAAWGLRQQENRLKVTQPVKPDISGKDASIMLNKVCYQLNEVVL